MPLNTLPAAQKLGNPAELHKIVKELQGLRSTLVDGAAAGTKMNIAAMRDEDTILSAVILADTWAIPTDDTANITIQPTKASGTITVSGNPVDGETVTVNGTVYTWKNTPTARTHVKITAGNNTAMATAMRDAINNYENRVETRLHGDSARVGGVVATSSAGVVTVTSVADGAGSGPVVTSSSGTTLAVVSTDPGAVTVTCATAVNNDTVTVAGVTFTIKTTVTDTDLHIAVKGTNTLQAAEIAKVVNAYEQKYGTLAAVATSAAAVATFSSRYGRTGNSIQLTEAATNVAVSGSGYLTGGTNTGGIKSTTNLATASLLVTWFDKQ